MVVGRMLGRAWVGVLLADHIAPVFEDVCRAHARRSYGQRATRIGRWWGNARDDLRRTGRRSTEEIDIVGVARGRVTLVGEVKWTSSPLDVTMLRDLEELKLPALRQAGFRLAGDLRTVLYCRSGFTDRLRAQAAADPSLRLVGAGETLSARA